MTTVTVGDEADAVVVDPGSYSLKAGFGGEDAPRTIFPCVVGRPRRNSALLPEDSYVGSEIQSWRDVFTLSSPMSDGIVTNWDDMRNILDYTYRNELRIASEHHPILFAGKPLGPKPSRERMTEEIFESFRVPSFCIVNQALLSLYASGRTTGIIVDSGYNSTYIVPIEEGFVVSRGISRMEFGGMDLTDHLTKMLFTERGYTFSNSENGYTFTSSRERASVSNIKQSLCYVALDFKHEIEAAHLNDELERDYELPDGRKVTIGKERFLSPEALFQPSLLGSESPGLPVAVFNSIKKSNFQEDLFANIVLSGGNTMFPGISDRIHKELAALTFEKVQISADPSANLNTWIGGSIAASLPSFREIFITAQEYKEHGTSIVHRKCLWDICSYI